MLLLFSFSFPYGIDGRMCDVIVLIPDPCLRFTVTKNRFWMFCIDREM